MNPINYRATSQDREALKLLFVKELAELAQSRGTYLEQMQAAQRQYESPDDYPLWMLTLRCGILSTEARLQWCKEALDMLNSMQERMGTDE